MTYFWGALAGLVWGALAAFINFLVSRACVKKNTSSSMMTANVAKLAIDIIALAAVFFLRGLLPFSFEAAIIATAASLSVLTIVFAYKISAS